MIYGDFLGEESVIKYEGVSYLKTPGMDLYVSEYGHALGVDKHDKRVYPKKLDLMRNGYLRTFYKGRTITMQRLVALTFGLINSLDEKLDIDHINGCRSDNRLTNLEAVTHAENIRRRDESGSVHNKPVTCCIGNIKIKEFESQLEAAKWLIETGQTESCNINTVKICICNAYNHKNGIKTAYGYEWK